MIRTKKYLLKEVEKFRKKKNKLEKERNRIKRSAKMSSSDFNTTSKIHAQLIVTTEEILRTEGIIQGMLFVANSKEKRPKDKKK